MNKNNQIYLERATTSFFLRKNRSQNSYYHLFCRVTLRTTKSEFSLKEKLNKEDWDTKNQKFIGKGEQAEYINTLIEGVSYKIKSLCLFNSYETAKEVILDLTKEKTPLKYVSEIVDDFMESNKKGVSYGTLKSYKVKLANLYKYENYIGKKLTPKSFTVVEGEKFVDWFCETRKTTNFNTATRNVMLYRKAMLEATRKGILEEFGLYHFKGRRDKRKSVVFLTLKEVEKIRDFHLENIFLARVRDMFIFQCYTGLSYCDLWSGWNIEESSIGKVIKGKRNKNGLPYFVPLNPSAEKILAKYEGKLPRHSNESYNRNLKMIATECGIRKTISSHTGRKTFATIQDAQGWSRESISKMLGHSSFKTTETHYLGNSDERIINEMFSRAQ